MYSDIINPIAIENYGGKLGWVIPNGERKSFNLVFRANLLFKTKKAVKLISYMFEMWKLK